MTHISNQMDHDGLNGRPGSSSDIEDSIPIVSNMTLDDYSFPTHRMQMQQEDPDRIPLVLVACGVRTIYHGLVGTGQF